MPRKKPFVASKKQLHRLSSIVALLKQDDNVTVDKITEDLKRAEQETGLPLGTGAKTVYRDMQTLRDEYQCPVTYDSNKACYTLNDKQWNFPIPKVMNDTEILAVILGAKYAEKLFGSQIADHIMYAAAEIMETNSVGSSIASRMDSFKILSSDVIKTTDKHFIVVFEAWRKCCCLEITYKSNYGKETLREIEPHGLVYYGCSWYVMAFCRNENDRRMFNASHIREAKILKTTFTPSEEIIESFDVDDLLIFSKMRDIVIELTYTGARFARKYKLHPKQKVSKQKDGSYILTAPMANEKQAVLWILQQAGEAVPKEPDLLVQAVKKVVKKLSKL